VQTARDQHDARLAAAHEQAAAALQAVATLHDLLEDLAEVFAAQVDAFFPFRTARGMQAFDVRSGKDYAMELFQQFFAGDPRSRDAFLLLVDTYR
jgi:predicted component of type VI protein secretion system